MKKKSLFLSTSLLVVLLTTFGCGNEEPEEKETTLFSLDSIQTENNEFQYKDIPFGTSSKEVFKKIPEDFEKMEGETSSVVSYYSKDSFDFYGCDAVLFLDFISDKLESAKIQFKTTEDDNEFQKILSDLTNLYGEPQTNGSDGDNFSSKVYSWGEGSTRLQAILLKTDSSTSAVIGIFKMK